MANEVGKAYVSIIPSMRGFSDDIRRQLRNELRGVEAEVKGKIDFNPAQATKDATEAIKAAQAAVPDLKGIKLEFDDNGLLKKVTAAVKTTERLVPKIKTEAGEFDSEGNLIRKVRRAAKIAEAAAPKIKLKTTIDDKHLLDFLGNLGGNPLRAIGNAAEDVTKLLASGLTPAFGGAAQAGAQLTATAISLIAVTGALIAVFLALVVVIGGALLVAIGSAIAGVAGLVAALGLTLPAAIVGLAPAIASLMFVFDGFGKIITAITQGDLKKFDKALDTLPPKTRALAESFKPLLLLKDEVQEIFFGTILEAFGKKLPAAISQFRSLTIEATKVFGDFAKNIIKDFTTIENKAKFAKIFEGVRPAVSSLLDGLRPLAQAFLNIAAAGSQGFAKLGAAVGNVLGKLAEALNRLAADGTLDRIIESFSKLIDVAGTELIGVFEDLARNAPEFLNVFREMLPVFRPLISAISDFLIAAGPGFVDFLNSMAQLFGDPAFVKSLTDLGYSLGYFLEQLKPLLPYLPYLLKFFTGLAIAAGLAAAALAFFLSTLKQVVDFFKSIFFGDTASQFDLVKNAVNGAKAALSTLKGVATSAVSGVVAAFKGLSQLGPVATQAISAVRSALSNAVGQLGAVARNIAAAVIGGLRTAISLAGGVGVAIVQGLIGGIKNMAKQAADAAVAVVKGAWSKAKEFLHSNSPSKLMMTVGEDFTLGFAIGIPRPGYLVNSAVTSIVSDAVAAATAIPTSIPLNFLTSSVMDSFNFDLGLDESERDKKVVLVADGVEIARLVNKKNKDLARR